MLDWLSRVVGSRRSLKTSVLVVSFFLILHLLYSWSSRPPNSYILLELGHNDRNNSFGLKNYVKSSYDWGALRPHFPVSSTVSLPSGTPLAMPRVQFDFQPESEATRARLDSYRLEIRQTFLKCWRSYRKRAWMRDELTPVSGKGKDTLGGWAATLIDSLDTLWIMGLRHEFKEAVEAVATIDWAKTEASAVNTFEITIRHLGGLLAAYDLSGEKVLLMKAIEIGDLLYAGFDRPSHLPGFWLDFVKAKNGGLEGDSRLPLASPGSLSLEFTRLSQLTGDSKYYDAISRVTTLMAMYQNQTRLPGLWPMYVDFQNIDFHGDNHFTLGALADSAYEYLPKMHALLSGTEAVYKNMTTSAFKAIKKHMIFRPMLPDAREDIRFTGDVRVTSNGKPYLDADVQHLSCFAGGMLALGGRLLESDKYVTLGTELTNGCIWAYEAFPTGIMPETFSLFSCRNSDICPWDEERWHNNGNPSLPRGIANVHTSTYLLRPEAIESIFVLYRITGRHEYQDAAWKMFKSIIKATKTRYGNSAIENVEAKGRTIKLDSMESFWMAETLKYFYLIFSHPDLISLDDYVFNTEAHPFQRLK